VGQLLRDECGREEFSWLTINLIKVTKIIARDQRKKSSWKNPDRTFSKSLGAQTYSREP